MSANILGLLGLCRRAGKLAVGFDATASAIKKRTAKALLFAENISPKTAKELRFLAAESTLPVLSLPFSKDQTGTALGLQKPVGALAVTDVGFADLFCKQCHQKEETI